MMVTAAALAAAQPIDQPTGLGAGPIQERSLAVRLTAPPNEDRNQDPYQDQQLKPFNVELPDAGGAQLHLAGARLRLKVPI
jgi:hypothetical protein